MNEWTHRISLIAVVAVVGLASSGCMYSREMSSTRRSIEAEFPGAEFDRKLVFTVGSVGLRVASWVTGLVPDEEVADVREYIDDVRRVKVGIYDTEHVPESNGGGIPVLRGLVDKGWEIAVQSREESEHVWVLYRARRDRVRDIFVIVLNEEELVIVRVTGHLDRVLQRAMRDHRPFSRLAKRR